MEISKLLEKSFENLAKRSKAENDKHYLSIQTLQNNANTVAIMFYL